VVLFGWKANHFIIISKTKICFFLSDKLLQFKNDISISICSYKNFNGRNPYKSSLSEMFNCFKILLLSDTNTIIK